ncbi:TorF family putative porin, partial [Caulobacter sp. B11]|uniref:TorF family putative porin n=1 Tax=Caulobacter sp. B11 TaxID=2048899 RepID=UPI002100FA9A
NLLKLALASAAASVALGGAAMAQDLTLSYNVGVASDYIFRGVSNSNEDPQIFGGVDATYGMGYAGVWARTSTSASMIRPPKSTPISASSRPSAT